MVQLGVNNLRFADDIDISVLLEMINTRNMYKKCRKWTGMHYKCSKDKLPQTDRNVSAFVLQIPVI